MPEFPGRLRPPRISAAPATPANGELYYNTATSTLQWWNGTAWITASGGTAPDATPTTKGLVQLAGDLGGTAAAPTVNRPKMISGAFGSGPPGSPADGDIWNATDVGGAGSGRTWQFRYNAGSASAYKWEFVGGSPLILQTSVAPAWGALSTWTNFPGIQYVTERAGDWIGWGEYAGSGPATTGSNYYITINPGGGITAGQLLINASMNFQLSMPPYEQVGVASGTTLALAYFMTGAVPGGMRAMTLALLPKRVA